MSMTRRTFIVAGTALGSMVPLGSAWGREHAPRSAVALHGTPKYADGFDHFDYADPGAPRGGRVVLQANGTFDSLNPWIAKGRAAAGITLTHDTLMARSYDEPFSLYGLVAETISIAEDGASVTFAISPDARWHDGSAITPADVIWTFNTLTTQGSPRYRTYYAGVERVEQTGERQVTFRFRSGVNRELPLILADMVVLCANFWQDREFKDTLLDPPLGSGPYEIEALEPNKHIIYRRRGDYWVGDLPVNRGHWNFDTIRFDYYRDRDVATEALKAGNFDLRAENSARRWNTQYDFEAVTEGFMVRERIDHEIPTGMQGFLFNTRRNLFADPRVRYALAHAFDFEWTNKTLMYDEYTRTRSFFSNTELSSEHGPPDSDELAILDPYRGALPDEVFTTPYAPPTTRGDGNVRNNLRAALGLLGEAGWKVDTSSGRLVNAAGQRFEFELLLLQPSLEPISQPFADNLDRLGITMSIRIVETSQYLNRIRTYDFDMIVASIGQSLSPGNEQRNLWQSRSAAIEGSGNLTGVSDPVVDELVETLIAAPDRAELVTRTRALDRVLLWKHLVIPHFHNTHHRLIYWNRFGRPPISPRYGLGFPSTWWIDEAREQAIETWRQGKSGAGKASGTGQ